VSSRGLPMSEKPPSRPQPWLMLFVHFFAGSVLLVMLGQTVPGFVEIFEDFEVDLPVIAQVVISLSYLVVSYWYLLPLLVIADTAVLFGLSRLPPRARWLARLWFWLVLSAILLLIVGTIVGVALPYMNLLVLIQSSGA
jgi:hypothetical protein